MFRKAFLITASIVLLPLFGQVSQARAIELEISGNGDESGSEIVVTTSSTITVEQSNEAEVQNDVNTDANTGGNGTSGNNGDVQQSTGNADVDTTIENSVNNSSADVGCCDEQQQDTSTLIKNNGSGSQNTATVNQNKNTTVQITQTVNINNTVNGSANTGDNTANNNNGNVSTTTGNITSSESIQNKNVNSANVHVNVGRGDVTVKISKNGTYSHNTVNANTNQQKTTQVNNQSNINNKSIWDLNSGKNNGNNNNGDVSITTGDIDFSSSIINDPVNIGMIDIDCCPIEEEVPPIIEPPSPVTPPSPSQPPTAPPPAPPSPPSSPSSGKGKQDGGAGNGGIGGGVAGKVGAVLAAAIEAGEILPATGADWWLFATIANIFMFLLGLYLRLLSGRSPGFLCTTI